MWFTPGSWLPFPLCWLLLKSPRSTHVSVITPLLTMPQNSPFLWSKDVCCCCSITKSCPTLHDPMDYSMPGLSITNSQNLLKLMSIKSVMLSNHLVLYHPLLLPPSVFPSIRLFSSESTLRVRWPKYWSFSFSISPSNEYSGLISFRMDWWDLLAVKGTLKSTNTTVQKHQFFNVQLSLRSNSHIYTWLLEKT